MIEQHSRVSEKGSGSERRKKREDREERGRRDKRGKNLETTDLSGESE